MWVPTTKGGGTENGNSKSAEANGQEPGKQDANDDDLGNEMLCWVLFMAAGSEEGKITWTKSMHNETEVLGLWVYMVVSLNWGTSI